jgi:hypothetical protein
MIIALFAVIGAVDFRCDLNMMKNKSFERLCGSLYRESV